MTNSYIELGFDFFLQNGNIFKYYGFLATGSIFSLSSEVNSIISI